MTDSIAAHERPDISRVLILDFGSQYNQLIARRVREVGVYAEVHPYDWPAEKILEYRPGAIILSGGPGSVTEGEPMLPADVVFELGVPVLGICYGMQATVHRLGGEVRASTTREYGHAVLDFVEPSAVFRGTKRPFPAWMSHGDSVKKLPSGFHLVARTADCPVAAAVDPERSIHLLQFHPEVHHRLRSPSKWSSSCLPRRSTDRSDRRRRAAPKRWGVPRRSTLGSGTRTRAM